MKFRTPYLNGRTQMPDTAPLVSHYQAGRLRGKYASALLRNAPASDLSTSTTYHMIATGSCDQATWTDM